MPPAQTLPTASPPTSVEGSPTVAERSPDDRLGLRRRGRTRPTRSNRRRRATREVAGPGTCCDATVQDPSAALVAVTDSLSVQLARSDHRPRSSDATSALSASIAAVASPTRWSTMSAAAPMLRTSSGARSGPKGDPESARGPVGPGARRPVAPARRPRAGRAPRRRRCPVEGGVRVDRPPANPAARAAGAMGLGRGARLSAPGLRGGQAGGHPAKYGSGRDRPVRPTSVSASPMSFRPLGGPTPQTLIHAP